MIKNFMQILDFKPGSKGKNNAKSLKKKLGEAVKQNNKDIDRLSKEITSLNAQLDAEIAKKEKKLNVYQSTMKALSTRMKKTV